MLLVEVAGSVAPVVARAERYLFLDGHLEIVSRESLLAKLPQNLDGIP